jgi:nitric oxide reductase NorD protein
MELDQILFKRFINFYKKATAKKDPELEKRTVFLSHLIQRLTILSRALTGIPIEIYTAEQEGGLKGRFFFLPASMSFFPTLDMNINYYVFRIFYLSVQYQLTLNNENDKDLNLSAARQLAKTQSESILRKLFDEYPALKPIHQQMLEVLNLNEDQPELYWLYGKWMKLTGQDWQDDLKNVNPELLKQQQKNPKTEIKAKPVEERETILVDKEAQEQFVLTHNFEKVETIEGFDGVWRDFDGDDDLKQHEDALNEVDLRQTVRVDDAAHSVYQAEMVENQFIPDAADNEDDGYYITYDEWDSKRTTYKRDFCKVFPRVSIHADPDYVRKTIAGNKSILLSLQKTFAGFHNRMKMVKRLNMGDEIDFDALTDLHADLHARHTPSEKVYTSKRKLEKDLSILFLLDLSLSSDGYAGGNKVLDVEKQVAILLGEIMHEYDIDFEIAGYYSKTRNYCTYQCAKAVDESWNKARQKVGGFLASGYTRIGPALRHAGMQLAKREARNKWLILLSDGKPNDYDKYEGKYGIEDIKQALRELNLKHIHSHAFAIEDRARYYLPMMFGNRNYNILSSPQELLKSFAVLYQKIKKV